MIEGMFGSPCPSTARSLGAPLSIIPSISVRVTSRARSSIPADIILKTITSLMSMGPAFGRPEKERRMGRRVCGFASRIPGITGEL